MFQVSFGTSYWYDISPSCRCTSYVFDTIATGTKKVPVTSLAKAHQIGVDIGYFEKSIFFKILTKKDEKQRVEELSLNFLKLIGKLHWYRHKQMQRTHSNMGVKYFAFILLHHNKGLCSSIQTKILRFIFHNNFWWTSSDKLQPE